MQVAVPTANADGVIELICMRPIATTQAVEQELGVSRPTALRLLTRMAEVGVLEEMAPGARGQRRYVAREMMVAVSGTDL